MKKDGVIFMRLKPKCDHESDDFTRLEEKVNGKQREIKPLTDKGKDRIRLELDIIKKTNTAKVFLLYDDIMFHLKESGVVFHGIMHCSYVCYLLGLTKVNPLYYGLPFERYYNEKRRVLPLLNIAVPKGKKETALRILRETYAPMKICPIVDGENRYVFVNQDGEWTEEDCYRQKLYTFILEEAEMKEYRQFTEEEIYQKALEYFSRRNISLGGRYQGDKQAEKIFSKTDGRYIYQEQFFEVCEKILGVSNKQADEFRKKLAFRKREDRDAIKQFFCWKLDEEGDRLFDYIYFGHIYAVSKAYIIGLLFLDL